MKRKVNINRPKLSADEINQHKNFDSVLKNSPGMGARPLLKKPWFLSGMVVVTAAIITTVLVLNKKEQQPVVAESVQTSDADSLALAAFYKAEEAKPCIAPPINGLDIPYTSFKVNAEKGAALDFKTGSKLNVPKDAFVDENGKPVKGDVELRYREFHDAADFFVSGIPMTYDSAGVRYQFESAGMMEMLAYKDGKPVNMAPGKTINVELASAYKGTEYNLYKLDTLKNNWSCLGKDKVESKYNKEIEGNGGSDPGDKKDIVKLEQTPEYKMVGLKKEEVKVEKDKQIAALPKPAPEPKKPNRVNKDKYTFNLDLDLTDFPEFAVYKNVQWELGAENEAMSNALWAELNKMVWEDATLKEGNKKGESYFLSLKKGPKQVNNLVVYPVFEGKNYEAAMKDFSAKFEKYTAALDKRKVSEKKIEEEYEAKIAALKKKQEELEAKWKKEMDQQVASMATQDKVMRIFRISSFGVYNCDNPSAYPHGVSCNATLTDERNSKLMCYEVYLVDRHKNGLFTFEKNPVTTFSFDPNSTNMLWTVENGVLYYLKPEQFDALKGGTQNVAMSRVEQQFKTVDEMKAFFNL
ncbi:MAG: hypothetical protein JWO44_2101 [Bacteroidetes bacterium]|nr:hypothetical protein [Bacteroidota bacterium]